jgi:hypothetical protein
MEEEEEVDDNFDGDGGKTETVITRLINHLIPMLMIAMKIII